MTALFCTFLVVNLVAFLQMAIDKRLAEKSKRRISEAQLIIPTLLGGIVGTLMGMLAFRHKTKKRSFQLKLLFALTLFAGTAGFIYSRGSIQ
jgi:uncharacterized membrane protein YsdA (DUF1294 family)